MIDESFHNAILENAKRLLVDARYLLSKGSYPTAVALTILGLEELGKFAFESKSWATRKVEKHRHRQKQVDLSFFFIRIAYILAVCRHFDIRCQFDKDNRICGVDRNGQIVPEAAPYLNIDIPNINQDRFIEIFTKSDEMKDAVWLFSKQSKNELNSLRNSALYVDKIGAEIRTPNAAIDFAQAEKILSLAERLLALTEDYQFDRSRVYYF